VWYQLYHKKKKKRKYGCWVGGGDNKYNFAACRVGFSELLAGYHRGIALKGDIMEFVKV
jgi:hypothetical protein